MIVKPVTHPSFSTYGTIIEGINTAELLNVMQTMPMPEGAVAYEPSVEALESLPVFETLRNEYFGGMPIEIGYCTGTNHSLDALEYHRDSELNLACTDMIVLIGRQQDITPDNTYDTALVEAFLVPKGTLIEFYATTLHYAPIGDGFRSAVVLPRGTNYPLTFTPASKLLTHVNKWLIAHSDAKIAGAHEGLIGENLRA